MKVCVFLTFIPFLVSGIGDNCPYENCDCYDHTIDCDYDELKTLPELHNVTITGTLFLSLSTNMLTTIEAGRLPPNLYGINFQMNPITTIEQTAFDSSATTLTILTFSKALFTTLPRSFLNLKSLKYLTIGDTQINVWDDDVLKHIGLTLETLILSNVGLINWPTWIPFLTRLSTLELSDMYIQIPDDAFDNQINTLFSLNFENCSLSEIPRAISKLTILKYVVLDSNNISGLLVPFNSTSITTLSLDKNIISNAVQLGEALLPIAGSLNTLQLRDNKLTSLPDFSAMVRLKSVYLTDNDISYIGSSKIAPSLNYLGLENNNLPSLYAFLQSGSDLGTVKFSSNFIKDLRGVDIPITVSNMDLTSNLITELTDSSFPPGSNMDSLTLDFNPISKISTLSFTNLPNLSYLSLLSTKLTRLPLSLSALTKLRALELSKNSGLVCTCLEKSLRNWSLVQKLEIYGDCGITTIQNFIDVMSEDCPD